MSNNTFSLERAKNGEPFSYGGAEAKFGSMSPDGHKFNIWFLVAWGWQEAIFQIPLVTMLLSMGPKKLEVKIWRNRVTGMHDATTEDRVDHVTRSADPNWELLKTKSEEI